MLEPSSQSSNVVSSAPNSGRKETLDWRGYAAVFVLALVVTTLHHVFEGGTKVALLFDGRHYFESCQRACALILALGTMHADKVAQAESAFREFVMLDGPVLPALFGSFYACFGHVPASEDWTKLVWLQTILQAIASTLICKLSFQLTRQKLIAFICAALWIFYPSALIASGRLMTEDIAVVLLLSLPLLLRGAMGEKRAEGSNNSSLLERVLQLFSLNQYGLAGGIISGLLILLKPGMIPSVVLTWLATTVLSRQKTSVVLSLLLGTGLALSPWLLYTKQTTGKASITVQRMPVHNALIGWDPETRGWQTNPPSGFERVLNTGTEPLPTIEGIWLSHPSQCCKTLFDKLGHLYSTPWNDYRAKALLMDARVQEFLHQILLFAGLFGFAAWLLSPLRKSRLALLCATAALGQCVYLMFEPVCRYAFPQFAFAPVFFALGLLQLFNRPTNTRNVILAGFAALSATALILYGESSSNQYLTEETSELQPKQSLEAVISVAPSNLEKADHAWILVDGDQRIEQSNISINGTKITEQLLPLNYFDSQRYLALNLMKEVAYGLNKPVTDFRIWRALPISVDLLQSGKVSIQLQAPETGCTIFGDKSASRNYLSPDFLCVNRLINSKTSLEMRNESPILSGLKESSFQLSGKREGDKSPEQPTRTSNTTRSNPRIMLMLTLPKTGTKETKTTDTQTEEKFEKDIEAKAFDENLRTADGDIKIGKSIIKAARTTATIIDLPKYPHATNFRIKLSGELRSSRKTGQVGIVVETITDRKRECFLGRLPSYLKTTDQWSSFKIEDVAPINQGDGHVTAISVALFPGPWQQIAGYGCDKTCTDTTLRKLHLEVEPLNLPTLEGKNLFYY
ncbi:MAG TPA: hypothetical protein V6C76_01735 [Drouetiella sp.]